MRPLIVLLIVLAALGGLFFAIFSLPGGGGTVDPGLGNEPSTSTDGSLVGVSELGSPSSTAERNPLQPQTNERTELGTPDPEQPKNAIIGHVKNTSGDPIEGAQVTLTRTGVGTLFNPEPGEARNDVHEKTDSNGRFTFYNVPTFDYYNLIARHPDYSRTMIGLGHVGREGEVQSPTLIMSKGNRVWGQVTDEGGQPIAGAELALQQRLIILPQTPDPERITTLSDENGKYEFANVSEVVRFMMVSADGFGTLTHSQIRFDPSKQLNIDVKLKAAAMIGGTVLGNEDLPLADAVVLAMKMPSAKYGSNSQAEADEEGNFTLDDLEPGSYSLSVRAPGFKPRALQRIETGDLSVVVRLQQRAVVSGRVVDAETGQPIPNGTVLMRRIQEHQPVSIPTKIKRSFQSPDGRFEINDISKGTYVVEGEAEGYAPTRSSQFTVTEGQHVPGIEVSLTRGGVLTGQLVSSAGDPVKGARVSSHDNGWVDDPLSHVIGSQYPTHATTRTAYSNAEGRFSITGLGSATYQIQVKAPGYAFNAKTEIMVKDGMKKDVGRVTMPKGGRVSGTVYGTDGEGLPGIQLVLEHQRTSGRRITPREFRSMTDDTGKYAFDNVNEGGYKLKAYQHPAQSNDPFINVLQQPRVEEDLFIKEGANLTHDLTLKL